MGLSTSWCRPRAARTACRRRWCSRCRARRRTASCGRPAAATSVATGTCRRSRQLPWPLGELPSTTAPDAVSRACAGTPRALPRVMTRPVLLALPLVAACAFGDDGKVVDPPELDGKGDGGLAVVERGRFAPNTTRGPVDVAIDRAGVGAVRFASFGATRVRIRATSPDGLDPYLAIDGPVPDHVGSLVAYDDDGGGGAAASIEVTLDDRGAYRVLAGSYRQ